MTPKQSSQVPQTPPSPGRARLFTPGPLNTSAPVKEAMLRDLGSRDDEFIATVRRIRDGILAIGGVSQGQGYEAVPLQGSGTYAIEAMVSCAVPRDGRLLVLVNGSYGARIARIAEIHGIDVVVDRRPENRTLDAAEVAATLAADPAITDVAAVHCETTTGILNPISQVGAVVRAAGRRFLVDAMSSFGGVDFVIPECHCEFLVSSSNKCIEGVPGFAFVIAERDALVATEGQARTLTLDLFDQWQALEKGGQFRFTPPTHVILAFAQALAELEVEGGVAARAARYRDNQSRLIAGMRELGFREYLDAGDQSGIITTFHYPESANFDFERFYQELSARDCVIYPGKITDADVFRIGTVGQLFREDIDALLATLPPVLAKLGVEL